MLSFDWEQQCTEKVVHFFDAHFLLDFGVGSGEIRSIIKKYLFVFVQDEVTVFDGNEKIEKCKEEPTNDETEEDQR